MKQLIALTIASLALVAAGCGSDDSSSSDSSGSTSSSSSSSSGSSGGGTAVTIKGFQFDPKSLTVKKGTKVTWTNEDTTAHNVVGGDLKSETLNQGDTYTFTADKPGEIDYVCTFHSNMKATLTVTG